MHIDDDNFLDHFTGKEEKGPRPGFIYSSDEGDLVGLRYDNWKLVFAEQRVQGTVQIWLEPFVFLRAPKNSICAPIPSNGTTSPQTLTMTG